MFGKSERKLLVWILMLILSVQLAVPVMAEESVPQEDEAQDFYIIEDDSQEQNEIEDAKGGSQEGEFSVIGEDPAGGDDLFTDPEEPVSQPVKITSVTVGSSSLPYAGKKLTPEVVVKAVVDGAEKILIKDTDYTVSYENNTNVGTATVTVTGQGEYTGTIKKTFKITKVALKSAKLKYSYMIYTGKARKQSNTITVTATVNGKKKTLKKNTDYTVSYKNNVNVGEAKVTIKGKGNYSGTLTKTFKIYPQITAVKTRYWKRNNYKWYLKVTAAGKKELWTISSGRDYGLHVDSVGGLGLSPLGVYYYYDNGTLVAVNAMTGKVKWKYKNSKDLAGGAHAGFDSKGNVYVVSGLAGNPIAVINKKGKLVKRISWRKKDDYMWPRKLQYTDGKLLLSAYNIYAEPVTLEIDPDAGKVIQVY